MPDTRSPAVHEAIVLAADGVVLRVWPRGARVQSLEVDGHGVVLGHPDPRAYERDACYLGAVVGRVANRIARGRFTLDGRSHRVPVNDGPNALHGGPDGFDRQWWRVTSLDPVQGSPSVTLSHVSPDGQMGFPGAVTAQATYTLAPGGMRIRLSAVTDAPTVVNLTQHAYFHLGGPRDVREHHLSLAASRSLATDADGIPTGVAPVEGTTLDLRASGPLRRVGDGVIDRCWLLDGGAGPAARLLSPSTGRWLEVHTDAPALQLYTGASLRSEAAGPAGHAYAAHDGVCLETQWPPDAVNHPGDPDFDGTVLRPGGEWSCVTSWTVGTDVTVP